MKVSVVCCYYNELNLLKKKLYRSLNEINKLINPSEIIIVDNNSNDGTQEYLKNIGTEFKNLKIIFNEKNLGKGGSIKKASKKASGDIIAIFDIDEYEVNDLKNCINEVKNNKDLVVGSRLINTNPNFLYKKNLYGVMLLTKLINLLFNLNLTDSAGATKVFKKKSFEMSIIKSNGFDFEFELICKFAKLNFKVDEISSKYHPRSYLEGKKISPFIDGLKIFMIILITFLTPKGSCLNKSNNYY